MCWALDAGTMETPAFAIYVSGQNMMGTMKDDAAGVRPWTR